jgi:hypothetical protein
MPAIADHAAIVLCKPARRLADMNIRKVEFRLLGESMHHCERGQAG